MLHTILATQSDIAALVARLALAIVILPHGLQKVFGWFGGYGLKGTTAYFVSTGLPLAVAYAVWSGVGVLGPEALPPKPFLDLVNAYGSPWGMRED